MANTNRPTTNTHQHVIIPPNGDALLGREVVRFRYYNNYPVVEKQIGQDPKYYVKRRPPIEATGIQVTTAPIMNQITSVFYDSATKFVWYVNNRTPSILFPAVGTVTEDTNRIAAMTVPEATGMFPSSTMEKYDVAEYKRIVVGTCSPIAFSKLHFYTEAGAFDSTVDLDIIGAGRIVFLDGYLFWASNANNGQRIYNSAIGDPKSWLSGANFIDAEMVSDQIVTLGRHHNHLIAFGRKSIEFFYNSSNEIGSPLSRQLSYSSTEVGLYSNGLPGGHSWLVSDSSVIEIGDVTYFIGVSNSSTVGLYKIEKFNISKVSDVSLDEELRSMTHIKLCTFDLNGEVCVLILDQQEVNLPLVYIPSLNIVVEFQWAFQPTNALAAASFGKAFGTLLFKTDGQDKNCIYYSGQYRFVDYLVPQIETISSQYVVDYLDFNNNANKHWKFVDLLGSFGNNFVAIGYRNDKYGYDNADIVNLPYVDASLAGLRGNIRFRNLGYSRRQGYVIFVDGQQEYLYKGIAVGYNQWGD